MPANGTSSCLGQGRRGRWSGRVICVGPRPDALSSSMRIGPSLLLASVLMLSPLTGMASEGEVVVELLSGGSVQGHVVEIAPGDHCTIASSQTGSRRTIPWASIRRIVAPGTPPAPTTPAPDAVPTAPPPPSSPPADDGDPQAAEPTPGSAGPTVFVTMKTPYVVALQKQRSDGGWDTACTSPCNVALPSGELYRVTRNGSVQGRFVLRPDASGKVVIDVAPRSSTKDAIGVVTLVIGSLITYGALVSRSEDSAPAMGLFGLGGIGAGTVLIATNRAHVDQHPGESKEVATRSTSNDWPNFVRRAPSAPLLSIRF